MKTKNLIEDMKHSPLPWKYEPFCWIGKNPIAFDIISDDDCIARTNLLENEEEGLANAILIIRAVNNFEPLLEALKEVTNIYYKHLEINSYEVDILRKAETAIQNAETDL